MLNRIVSLALASVLGIGAMAPNLVLAQMYDRFNGSVLAASRWQPPRVDNSIQHELSVSRGWMHMQVRGYADSSQTSGDTTRSRIRMHLSEGRVTNTDGTNRLSALQSFAVVRRVNLQSCSNSGAAPSEASFIQTNAWFNDGRSSGPLDFMGDVFAILDIHEDTDNQSPRNVLDVRYGLWVCDDSSCQTIRDLVPPTSLLTVKVGERVSLRSSFNETKQRVNFTVKPVGKPAVRKSLDLSTITTIAGPMSTPRFAHSVQTQANPADCELGQGIKRPYADIDVDVDYVRASFIK